jgi:uncharacterized protein YecE (DUF72 family)
MATRFHVGAKELRGAVSAYAKRFDLLEVAVLPAAGATVESPKTNPSLATLRKWRRDVPPHFDFCVVAGPSLAKLRPSPELDVELACARAAIDALQARCFLLRTPGEVTPGAVSRERMAKLLERLPRDVTYVVWEPSGLWEVDDAAVAAKRWGIVLAVDPARDPVPAGPVVYGRLRALGEQRSFGPSALERIVHKIGQRRDVYLVVESATALEEAKRIRQIAQRKPAAGDGGMSRLIRPRGGLVVRDDEQE